MNKINKKKAIIIALLIVALIVWMASLALADGGNGSPDTVVQAVTLNDLGASDTGLLPSNPFYFSEEWLRNVQRALAKDPVSKSTLELQILNDKAAELLTASELTPVDAYALNDAITNYGNELQVMNADLQTFNGKSADVDSLLSDLTAKMFMHYQILEEIKVENGSNNGEIDSIQSQIDTTISEVPNGMSDSSQFGEVLSNAITSQTDLGAELRSLPFVDGLEEASNNPSVRTQLDQVRQGQVLEFEGRSDADGLSPDVISGVLGQLPVSDLNKVRLVGDLRDFVIDSGLKSGLDTLRSALLVHASSSGEISAGDVSDSINYAKELINEAGNGQQSNSDELIGANALLSEATTDLASGSYGNAFGEANDAASIVDSLLLGSEDVTVNSKDNISSLSDRLSALEGIVSGQGLTNTDDPKLFALFGEVNSILSDKPSVSDVYRVEESLDEINFALDNLQNELPSALIPVPGENSLGNAADEQSSLAQTQVGEPQYCPEIYEPVCGSDGTTYPNRCFEELINVAIAYRGGCKPVSTSTATLLESTSTVQIQNSN